MRFKKYDKRYLPMLWIGLAIWAVGFGGSWLMELAGVKISSQETLMGMFKSIFQVSPIGVVLLGCIFGPVLEEFSFRLWGVGKRWTTIICLVLMAMFSFGEIGFWGILLVVGIVVAMRLIKDAFKRNWAVTLLSSAAFALCHISGFNGFSLGMVLGLMDIFGMAMVMCWLTLNLSFWFSCLLHVCNNSLAFLLPLVFLNAPVNNVFTNPDIACNTTLEALKPFADNKELILNADNSFFPESPMTEFICVDEPQEIAARLLSLDTNIAFHSLDHYEFLAMPKNEELEERVVWTVKFDTAQYPDFHRLLPMFIKDYEAFAKEKLIFDTADVEMEEVWMVYDDGREEQVTDSSDNLTEVWIRMHDTKLGMRSHNPISIVGDDPALYAYPVSNNTHDMLSATEQVRNALYGYSLDFRPSGKMFKLVTIK